jgi:YfiR/HmsC-like
LDFVNQLRESLRHKTGKSRRWRTARLRVQLCTMALLLLTGSIPLQPQSAPSVEYQVKAAFLFNFAKFIEWPTDAFSNEKTPITLCVFRYDPFGSALDEVIRGKTINNRELTARRINELPDLKSCHLVFVSEREDKLLSEIDKSLKGGSVLVVGESAEFAERGGAIQLFLEENKLRFAVNVDAVQRARLQVSSKLLALARVVHDGGHPKGD